jgi:hypothetical protein
MGMASCAHWVPYPLPSLIPDTYILIRIMVPSNNDRLSSTWTNSHRCPSTTYVSSQRTGNYLVILERK